MVKYRRACVTGYARPEPLVQDDIDDIGFTMESENKCSYRKTNWATMQHKLILLNTVANKGEVHCGKFIMGLRHFKAVEVGAI